VKDRKISADIMYLPLNFTAELCVLLVFIYKIIFSIFVSSSTMNDNSSFLLLTQSSVIEVCLFKPM